MILTPTHLSLIVTRRCTAACEHCCFGCAPTEKEAIPVARLRTLIDEASSVPSIRSIGLGGGEPFLLGGSLAELVARATARGFEVGCNSNAYWAVDERAAYARLRPLQSAGLSVLEISTGTFHERYVPVERVILAAVAAAELGIEMRLFVESCAQSTFDASRLRNDKRLRRAIAASRVSVDDIFWSNGVRGDARTTITHDRDSKRESWSNAGGCETILDVVAVTPDQQLYACCGLTMEGIPELRLGSVATHSLAELLRTAEVDVLKLAIHVLGPERILAFVRACDPSYELPLDLVHTCTVCLHLHRDAHARAVVGDYASELYREIRHAQESSRATAATHNGR